MGLMRDTMTVGVMRVLLTILIFASDLVASRYLGVALKGEYFFLTSTILLVGVILTGGLHLGNIYYSRFIPFPELAANSLLFLLGIGVISFLVGFPLLAYVPALAQAGMGLKVAFLTCLVAESAFAIFLNFFIAANRLSEYAYVRLLRRGLFLILILTAWLTWSASLGLIIGLYLFTSLMTLFFLGTKLFRGSEGLHYSLGSLGKCLSYGMRSQAMVTVDMANLRLNAILLGFWASPVQNGLYSVALNFGQGLWLLTNVLSVVIQAGVSNPPEQQLDHMKKLSRHAVLLTVLGGILLALLAGPLITRGYGLDFQDSASLLRVMIPGFIIYSLYSVLSSFMITNGRANAALWCSIGGLLINLSVGMLLIPLYGGLGAAIALSLGLAASTLLLLIMTSIIYKISPSSLLLLNKDDVIYLFDIFRKKLAFKGIF